MTRLVFIDTETTSLRPDRRAWEIGLIVREDGQDKERQWFISSDDLDLGNADPMSLKIGGFYDRHPEYNGTDHAELHADDEWTVLREVEALTRGAHLVGAVPNFDADVLGTRMRDQPLSICPSWHHHLIDVEALMVGYISGSRPASAEVPLPWRSDDLALAVGVEIREEDRHTALGDARWARDIYDAVMGVR